jgi:hypothetical protein
MFSRVGRRLRAFWADAVRFLVDELLIGSAAKFVRFVDVVFDAIADRMPSVAPLVSILPGPGTLVTEDIRRFETAMRVWHGTFRVLTYPLVVTVMVGSLFLGIAEGIMALARRASLRFYLPNTLTPEQAALARVRGVVSSGLARDIASLSGVDGIGVTILEELAKSLPTPEQIITAFRRGTLSRAEAQQLFVRLGFEPWAFNLILKASEFFPSPSDLVSWMAREAFEEDKAAKYGLDDEFQNVNLSLFEAAGVSPEIARYYWRVHWEHPSLTQIATMLWRDVLDEPNARDAYEPGSASWAASRERSEQQVWEWFKLVEIPPFWRERLIRSLYVPLTRVDVRRAWELGVVDDADVLRAYLDQGYRIDDAQKLLLFTKVERTLPWLKDAYSKGWISSDDVRKELQNLGLSPEKTEQVFQRIVKLPAAADRIKKERDLTKSEIIRGVKKGILTNEQAVGLLMEMGYDADEANYLLLINLEAGSSPETLGEFKKLVAMDRKARGLEAVVPSDELIQLEKEIAELERKREEAVRAGQPVETIAQLDAELFAKRYRLDMLRNSPTGS